MNSMKNIIVWGTGAVLRRYYKILDEFNILYFIDKDIKKQGTFLNEIQIRSPQDLNHQECCYIILMTDYYMEILESIKEMDIPEDKIIPYIYIGNILEYTVETKRGVMFLSDWVSMNDKKIMLISHSLERTGAPLALLNLAIILKRMGYSVLMTGFGTGSLIEELENNNIDYIEDTSLYYQNSRYLHLVSNFEFVVVNTRVLENVVSTISRNGGCVLWWIHESEEFYTKNHFESYKNVYVYGVGKRAMDCFNKYYPKIVINELLYSVQDFYKEIEGDKGEKLIIAVIGMIQFRKGLDVLAEALGKLSRNELCKIKLLVIGKLIDSERTYWESVKERIPDSLEFYFLGELAYKKIQEVYKIIDLLIVPSRDDPMPIVVTEAMMHCVSCAVSNNVGQKTFIEQGKNGFVFYNAGELAELISWGIANRGKLDNIGKNSREIYINNFSMSRMQDDLEKIIPYITGEGVSSNG